MSSLLDRPRSTTEILDAAFVVLRRHYGTLVVLAMLVLSPSVLLRLWASEHVGRLGFWILDATLGAVAGAITIAVVAAWLQGEALGPGAALARVARRIPALLGVTIIVTVMTLFGLVMLVVPGLLVYANLFAAPAALVVEGLGVSDALQRSSDLAEGHLLRTMGGLVVTQVVVLLAQVAFGVATGLGIAAIGGSDDVAGAVGVLAGALVSPFVPIVVTLLYFDLRLRKEAFDLERLAAELPPLPTAP